MFFGKNKRLGWQCEPKFKQLRLFGLWVTYAPDSKIKYNRFVVWLNQTRLV